MLNIKYLNFELLNLCRKVKAHFHILIYMFYRAPKICGNQGCIVEHRSSERSFLQSMVEIS